MNTHVSYLCGKYPKLAAQYKRAKRAIDNTQNIQDRMDRNYDKEANYYTSIAISMVQNWLSSAGTLEELAHMLNERPERGGQVFEEQFDRLYWLDENQVYVEPNSEALNPTGDQFIVIADDSDITEE